MPTLEKFLTNSKPKETKETKAYSRSNRFAQLENDLEFVSEWLMTQGESYGWPSTTLLYRVMRTGCGGNHQHSDSTPYRDIPAIVLRIGAVLNRLPEQYFPIIQAKYFTPVLVQDGSPRLKGAELADLLDISRPVFLSRLSEAHAWISGALSE